MDAASSAADWYWVPERLIFSEIVLSSVDLLVGGVAEADKCLLSFRGAIFEDEGVMSPTGSSAAVLSHRYCVL